MKRNSASCSLLLVAFFAIGQCAAYADKNVIVSWDASPDADVTQYRLYYGEVGGTVTNNVQVSATSGTIPSVRMGKRYFAYATALTGSGAESRPSESLLYSTGVQLAAVSTQNAVSGTPLSLRLGVTDATLPASSLTYQLVSGPAGLAVSTSGLVTWTPTRAQAGSSYDVSVQVSASSTPASTDTETFQVTVSAPVVNTVNTAPRLVSVGGESWAGASVVERSVLDNGSFEGGAQGWTASGNQFVASRPNEASDGTWLVRFNSGQTEPNGVLTTTISTVAGASYDLSFDMGTIAYNQKEQRLKVTVRGSSELLSETSAITGVMGGTPKWAAQAYTFVADSSSTTLTFRDVSTVTQDLDLLLDNVRVVEKRSAPISLEATVDQTLTATVEAVDNDSPANVLSYTLVSGPAGATLSSNGQFVWQPTQAPMTALVTVRVSDNGSPSLSDTETFEVVVARNGNSAPVLVVPDQGALAGVEFALPLKATDPDGPADKLTYSLVSGPAGSYVDSSSGTFRWTPSLALLGTSVVVEVAVRDSGSPSLSDSARFTVYVSGPNTAPVLAPIPDQTVPRGEELRLTIRGSDADLPADVLTYTLLVGPSGASLDYATGAFQWRPDASQNLGPYEVRVRVSDDGSPSLGDTKIFRVTVTGPNTAPRLTTVPNQTVGRGSLVMLNLTATDADAPGQTLTYSLVSGPAGATVSAGGLFQYTPSEVGSSVITVQVSDNGVPALTDRKSFTLTATAVNQAPVLSNAADQKVSPGQVLMLALGATDSDTPRNKLTYRLISGPPGAMVDAKTGIFMWRLPKSAPTSLYDVTVSVTDDGAPPLSDTTTFRVTVAGKASRSTQGVEDDSGVLKWVATLNGAETLHFQHAIEPQKQSGEWTHYLESSEDLIHWRRIGPLSPGEELRDTTAGEVSHRFYRVQVEEGSTSSSEAEQIAAVE